MRTILKSSTALLFTVAALYPAAGAAQTEQSVQVGGQQVATQCLENLNAFAQRMNEDQFWV